MKRPYEGAIRLAFCGFALAASAAFADTDVYGNVITYESDGVTVKYRFWYADRTAEAMSGADSASAEFTSPDAFEPRCRTWAVSDGECPYLGLTLFCR